MIKIKAVFKKEDNGTPYFKYEIDSSDEKSREFSKLIGYYGEDPYFYGEDKIKNMKNLGLSFEISVEEKFVGIFFELLNKVKMELPTKYCKFVF